MNNKNIFYKRAEERYKKRGVDIDKEELVKLINNHYQKARQNYLKLSSPKFSSSKAYISNWINEEVGKDIINKIPINPITKQNSPDDLKESIRFLNNYPYSKFLEIKKNHLKFTRLEKDWLKVVKERNTFSQNKGYETRLNMILDYYIIPKSEYKDFDKNINNVINFCNQQLLLNSLNLESSNFCLICNTQKIPYKDIYQCFNNFKKNISFFRKNENKIYLQYGENSNTNYIKETDIFKITINQKSNINHQIVDLIHELAHVKSMAKILRQDKYIKRMGAYKVEKAGIEIELEYLKKYFPNIFILRLGSILQIICQTIFELDIYQNPDKNPNKLYFKYLNKCFKKNININDSNFLLNYDILYKSFSQIIYAIAYTNVLEEMFHPSSKSPSN